MKTWHLCSRAQSRAVYLLAVVCIVFLAWASLLPSHAFAVQAGSGGIVTVQIVAGSDAEGNPIGDNPVVVLNKRYGFDTGQTWADILDKAVAEGDLEGYALSDWGFPTYFTVAGQPLENAADWSW